MSNRDLDYYPRKLDRVLEDLAAMNLEQLRQERLAMVVRLEEWGDYFERVVGVIDALAWMRDPTWQPFDWDAAVRAGIVPTPGGTRPSRARRPHLRVVE